MVTNNDMRDGPSQSETWYEPPSQVPAIEKDLLGCLPEEAWAAVTTLFNLSARARTA
jgi:hypothetical protein